MPQPEDLQILPVIQRREAVNRKSELVIDSAVQQEKTVLAEPGTHAMESMSRERRLVLALADGTGDFDLVRVFMLDDMVILDGYVEGHDASLRADARARNVGFASVMNLLITHPQGSPHASVNQTRVELTRAYAHQGWIDQALIQLKSDIGIIGVERYGLGLAPTLDEIGARLQIIINGLRDHNRAA